MVSCAKFQAYLPINNKNKDKDSIWNTRSPILTHFFVYFTTLNIGAWISTHIQNLEWVLLLFEAAHIELFLEKFWHFSKTCNDLAKIGPLSASLFGFVADSVLGSLHVKTCKACILYLLL